MNSVVLASDVAQYNGSLKSTIQVRYAVTRAIRRVRPDKPGSKFLNNNELNIGLPADLNGLAA
jgi:hypothetical protein